MTRRSRSNVFWHELPAEREDLPPVLFLHGFLGNGLAWREVAESCAGVCRALCPDLPGHGRAGCMPNATFERVAEQLAAGLHKRGITRCGLVGYSMGGRIALYLAMTYPELFDRVVLESASPGIRLDTDREARVQSDLQLAKQLAAMGKDRQQFRAFLEQWYAQPIFCTLAGNPLVLARLIDQRMDNAPRELAKAIAVLGPGEQPSLWERLPEFDTPTLLIAGAEDRKYRIIAEEMSELAPRMAVEAFTGCSHNVHFENLAGYTTALKSFLTAAG